MMYLQISIKIWSIQYYNLLHDVGLGRGGQITQLTSLNKKSKKNLLAFGKSLLLDDCTIVF